MVTQRRVGAAATDLALFVFEGCWVALGLRLLRRAPAVEMSTA